MARSNTTSPRRYRNAAAGQGKTRSNRATTTFTPQQLRSVGVKDAGEARSLMQAFKEVGHEDVTTPAVEPTTPSIPLVEHAGRRIPQSLATLIAYVNDAKFKESWRVAWWSHAKYKERVYAGAYLDAVQEMNAARDKLTMKADNFDIPAEDRWKAMTDDTALNALTDIANQFERLKDHCGAKAAGLEAGGNSLPVLGAGFTTLAEALRVFRAELEDFAAKSLQDEVADFVARLLLAYFQNPLFPRNKFFSILFAGPPGTGKTTLCRQIARVLCASGLFEGGFCDKGKPDFIGQYLGETPHLTKRTLSACALDGVLFIDEAYSLCNQDSNGQVDMYGTEFATALVDFMSRFKGLGCVMVAGYEKEMTTQFLAANEGLPRRFPHRFLLRDMDTQQLTGIVKDYGAKLLRPVSKDSPFSKDAADALEFFIDEVRARRKEMPHLHELLANQAGSAANIAEFVAMYTLGQPKGKYFKAKDGILSEDIVSNNIDKNQVPITVEDVTTALRGIVSQMQMSNRKKALRELATLFG